MSARPVPAVAQSRETAVLQERREFAAWLTSSSSSPYAVLTQRTIGEGFTFGGADADVPLAGLARHRITERDGIARVEVDGKVQNLQRHRPVSFGQYRLRVTGPPGRSAVTLFAPAPREPKSPRWYPYDPALAVEVTLTPAESPRRRRLLAADGIEVEALEAGTVSVSVAGARVRLQVYRIPDPTGEESELEIYFRDLTNDGGTYPAGRFVSLEPMGGMRYRLDFNRARNPFCAYSTVFACPLPWRGNALEVAIEAGEKYLGGGLTPPKLDPPR